MWEAPELRNDDFQLFQDLIYRLAGVHLLETKKAMVNGRLMRRLRALQMGSFTEYHDFVQVDGTERDIMVDLLTTHETYFFREPEHFHYLGGDVLKNFPSHTEMKIWSAAASTGEEAYSIAMVAADYLGAGRITVHGSDISHGALEAASEGVYPIEQSREIPRYYLKKFCMKGTGPMSRFFRISGELRSRVKFYSFNLAEMSAPEESYDIIFLRNVLIYFDPQKKKETVRRTARSLKHGGLLITGMAESISGITDDLKCLKQSIYQRK